MTTKTLHEWGYRHTWPPLIDDLTPRQVQEIALAEQAEAYIQEEQVDGRGGARGDQSSDRDLSTQFYDKERSRREWRDQWNNINGS
ncbi:hypothetical protein HZS55_09110 [Halosimplex rubrum]|uniref:Uncharacterized protein n=1 Tax=Halosimplex rubrum TaxID=869889 RepID=A0A7D5NZL7_9EURY|nr:hypothetical protein [Halosimplex rubrum]QLH77443.1 hypothetical protein HZS55_09110 [Halosimplex rubrum]